MKPDLQLHRRYLVLAGSSLAASALAACVSGENGEAKHANHGASPHHAEEEGEAEVTPGEDLMQEHGVLDRILLVYEDVATRLEAAQAVDPAHIASAASIIQRFIEAYHEKQEEESVFPRLEKANREVALVATLREQHKRGRELTAAILKAAKSQVELPAAEVAAHMRAFVRMYRPHSAREETVVFRVFRELVGRHGYREIGEEFEQREHALIGEHGFDDIVGEVDAIEQAFDLADLSRFTPKV